jgi:3'(2'), 5'-bisphosphate nucleotidase
MAQSAPLILRLVASSITAVNRAGNIIRDIMSKGDLGIVEKVRRCALLAVCRVWHQ